MPVTIRREPDGRVIGVATGAFHLEEAMAGIRDQWDASAPPPRAVLWDLRAATFDISGAEVRELASFVLQGQAGHRPGRVALVASGDTEFGLLRIYERVRERSPTQVRVFRSYDEADAWTRAGGAEQD